MPHNQNLKKHFPNERFYDFLEKCCGTIGNKYFVFNIDSYKKAKFYDCIAALCNELKGYYYPSKQHYLMREQKFSKFTTILRHICNHNGIPFTTQINYANNTYYICYYIKHIAYGPDAEDSADSNDI